MDNTEENAKPKLGRLGSLRAFGSVAASSATAVARQATSSIASVTSATSDTAVKIPQVLGFVKDSFGQDLQDDEPSTSAESAAPEKILELRSALGTEDCDTLGDDFLIKCLIQHSGDVTKAAVVAKGFISFRRSVSWPFRIAARDVNVALRSDMHWLLPRTADPAHTWRGGGGDTVGPAACLVYNASKLDVRICPVEEFQKMGSFLMERATDDRATQERGIALIVDNAGVELLPMLRIMSLSDMKRGVFMWKGAFPCRVRRLWVVDAPKGSGKAVGAVLKLLAPKVQERIRFARRTDKVGVSSLVEDLGGIFKLPRSLGGEQDFDWDASISTWLPKEDELKDELHKSVQLEANSEEAFAPDAQEEFGSVEAVGPIEGAS